MPLAKKKSEEKFTYENYITWPDDERWEIIDGEACNMSPAPTLRHQRIVGKFYSVLEINLKGKSCTPFMAPTDVVFSKSNVVQPDILVVCDKNKLTKANIQGAPDLVIEVLSPSTASRDRRDKRELYEKYGVKEYIVVDIMEGLVERFYLDGNNVYGKSDIFTPEESISLFSLNNMEIPLPEIFEGIE